jgi:cyanate lyase
VRRAIGGEFRELQALIEEEFGNGTISAIDFEMRLERLLDPKSDCVKTTMSDKFLPYKYCGAAENEQALGLKEG